MVFTNRVPTTAMRGFGVTSVSMAVETHITRVADVLGLDPWEIRLKNANRMGDTTGNLVAMQDPSTVPVTLATAEKVGKELAAEYRTMSSERRSGDLLPEHLVAQQAPEGVHVLSRTGAVNASHSNGGSHLMAKHRGRGFATIEYPTGMNQNGDPSQAWIKLKPDGRVDVFSGTVDIGQGSKTVHTQIVADALGVPYDWVTMDNTNTDSSAVCTGTFASRGTFIGGNAVRLAAERVRERILDIASKELEIDAGDLEIADGEVTAKGAPDRKISVSDVAGAATYAYGELISGQGTALKPLAEVNDDDGSVTASRTRRSRTRPAWPTSRSTTRPARWRSPAWSRSTTSGGRSTRCSSRARSRVGR